MKKFFFALIFLLFVSFVLLAQSPNNEQRLVGSWTSMLDNSTIVFNSNGTFSGFDFGERYAVAGDKIAFFEAGSDRAIIFEFRISNDGRTLILIMGSMGGLGNNITIGFPYRRNT